VFGVRLTSEASVVFREREEREREERERKGSATIIIRDR